MKVNGTRVSHNREEYKNAQALARQILNHPKLRGKLYGRYLERNNVEIDVVTTLEEESAKEVVKLTPVKKTLTKAEKRELHKKLAGSAKHFSLEGLKESDRIANREEWEEEDK